MTDQDEDGEAPLDPAMQRVQRKLVRLLIVSTSIMIVGIGAVIAGIFYRVSQMEAEDAERQGQVALGVPAADLLDVALSQDELVLTIGGKAPRIEVRDRDDGRLLQTFALEP